MTDSYMAYAPVLGLLVLLVLLAWGVQWIKRRVTPAGTGLGAEMRVVSQIMLGPQQRVVVVEVNGPSGPVQLTLGVTPQHVRTLHTATLPREASAASAVPSNTNYKDVAAALKKPAPETAA